VVEHRAGTKIAHVDALSRHVGTIVQGGTLDKEDVFREQAKDVFCLKQNPGTYESKRNFFWMMMGYYTGEGRAATIS